MTKFGCNYNNSTTNRGVEAKEVEIVNTRLDRNVTESSSSFPADSSAPTEPPASLTDSYVQVVVQKQRRARADAQTSPRLPAASSPIRQTCETAGAGAGDGNVLLLPASVLLACPPQQPLPQFKIIRERTGGAADGEAGRGRDALQPVQGAEEQTSKNSTWKMLSNVTPDRFDSSENVPERVEVYYFERHTGAYLATCGARRATAVERAWRRGARAAAAWGAELLAAAHLLLALPTALLVAIERCVLTAARDAVTGGVQTAADYALKPALALAFNVLLQPPLVFAANVARALHEVVRPLALAAGAALAPAARLLGALRLVSVRVDARCRCGGHPV